MATLKATQAQQQDAVSVSSEQAKPQVATIEEIDIFKEKVLLQQEFTRRQRDTKGLDDAVAGVVAANQDFQSNFHTRFGTRNMLDPRNDVCQMCAVVLSFLRWYSVSIAGVSSRIKRVLGCLKRVQRFLRACFLGRRKDWDKIIKRWDQELAKRRRKMKTAVIQNSKYNAVSGTTPKLSPFVIGYAELTLKRETQMKIITSLYWRERDDWIQEWKRYHRELAKSTELKKQLTQQLIELAAKKGVFFIDHQKKMNALRERIQDIESGLKVMKNWAPRWKFNEISFQRLMDQASRNQLNGIKKERENLTDSFKDDPMSMSRSMSMSESHLSMSGIVHGMNANPALSPEVVTKSVMRSRSAPRSKSVNFEDCDSGSEPEGALESPSPDLDDDPPSPTSVSIANEWKHDDHEAQMDSPSRSQSTSRPSHPDQRESPSRGLISPSGRPGSGSLRKPLNTTESGPSPGSSNQPMDFPNRPQSASRVTISKSPPSYSDGQESPAGGIISPSGRPGSALRKPVNATGPEPSPGSVNQPTDSGNRSRSASRVTISELRHGQEASPSGRPGSASRKALITAELESPTGSVNQPTDSPNPLRSATPTGSSRPGSASRKPFNKTGSEPSPSNRSRSSLQVATSKLRSRYSDGQDSPAGVIISPSGRPGSALRKPLNTAGSEPSSVSMNQPTDSPSGSRSATPTGSSSRPGSALRKPLNKTGSELSPSNRSRSSSRVAISELRSCHLDEQESLAGGMVSPSGCPGSALRKALTGLESSQSSVNQPTDSQNRPTSASRLTISESRPTSLDRPKSAAPTGCQSGPVLRKSVIKIGLEPCPASANQPTSELQIDSTNAPMDSTNRHRSGSRRHVTSRPPSAAQPQSTDRVGSRGAPPELQRRPSTSSDSTPRSRSTDRRRSKSGPELPELKDEPAQEMETIEEMFLNCRRRASRSSLGESDIRNGRRSSESKQGLSSAVPDSDFGLSGSAGRRKSGSGSHHSSLPRGLDRSNTSPDFGTRQGLHEGHGSTFNTSKGNSSPSILPKELPRSSSADMPKDFSMTPKGGQRSQKHRKSKLSCDVGVDPFHLNADTVHGSPSLILSSATPTSHGGQSNRLPASPLTAPSPVTCPILLDPNFVDSDQEATLELKRSPMRKLSPSGVPAHRPRIASAVGVPSLEGDLLNDLLPSEWPLTSKAAIRKVDPTVISSSVRGLTLPSEICTSPHLCSSPKASNMSSPNVQKRSLSSLAQNRKARVQSMKNRPTMEFSAKVQTPGLAYFIPPRQSPSSHWKIVTQREKSSGRNTNANANSQPDMEGGAEP